MNVEPIGLPAPLNAWRKRESDPVLVIRCGAAPGCGTQVGAVYRTPDGVVVESRISVPEQYQPKATDLGAIADIMGSDITGLLDDFTDVPTAPQQSVRVQVDLLHTALYWQDPAPLCPEHGPLRIDRAALAATVRRDEGDYAAQPR